MKKIVSILILILVLSSCEKQNPFEKNLIDDSQNTFWARKAKDSLGNFNYFGIQMIFNKDKTAEGLCSDNENIKGKSCFQLESRNEKKSKDWDYYVENDLFFMFPDVYKITKYSKDTIYMHLLIGKQEQFIMVRKKIK